MIRNNNFWTPTDCEALREAADRGLTLTQTALRLRRTKSAVGHRARILGITFVKPRRLPYAERFWHSRK